MRIILSILICFLILSGCAAPKYQFITEGCKGTPSECVVVEKKQLQNLIEKYLYQRQLLEKCLKGEMVGK